MGNEGILNLKHQFEVSLAKKHRSSWPSILFRHERDPALAIPDQIRYLSLTQQTGTAPEFLEPRNIRRDCVAHRPARHIKTVLG